MSDKMRWRWSETNTVMAAVDRATMIEIGDLVYLHIDDVKPAVNAICGNTISKTLQIFHATFLGVAMQRSRAGDTSPIRVATTGVFEFDCTPATFEIGDLIGPVPADVGTLLNQHVVAVGNVTEAIGRVARREVEASTSVLFAIQSTIMTGGVQAPATAQ